MDSSENLAGKPKGAAPPPGAIDYISKSDLEAAASQLPVPENHVEYFRLCLNLPPSGFWDKYLDTDAEFWIGKFYEMRGEQNLEHGEWAEPATEKDKKYDYIPGFSLDGTLKRRMYAEMQVKDNPFVKVSPTIS